jgi:hypothetical protein
VVRQQSKDKYIVILPRPNTSVECVLLTCVFIIQLEESNNLDTAREARAGKTLKNLKEGNIGFAGAISRHPHDTPAWQKSLEKGQHPFSDVLGCRGGSRVPPGLVFDLGSGIFCNSCSG